MTGSRGGFFATLGGALTFLLLAGVRGRKNAVALGFGLLTVGLAVGAAFFNYGDFLADRLTTQGLASDHRLAVYALTWGSIADAPLLGFGDGTFKEIFPMYRDKSIAFISFWDKAHNSYLELLQGLGVPVALLFLAAIVFLAGRCVVAALTRRHSITAPLAASAATVIVGLHAFVDFSLQNPGGRLDLGRAAGRSRAILEQQNRDRSIAEPTGQSDGRRRRFQGRRRRARSQWGQQGLVNAR